MAQLGQDFEVYEGDSETFEVVVYCYDQNACNFTKPMDLRGSVLIWSFGRPGALPLCTKSSTIPTEINIVDPVSGKVWVHLSSTDTDISGTNRRFVVYQHFLKVETPDGEAEIVMAGNMTVWRTLSP